LDGALIDQGEVTSARHNVSQGEEVYQLPYRLSIADDYFLLDGLYQNVG